MRRPGHSGVTLIELMVVFSIIAVMLGAGLALMTESNKDRGLRAARGSVLGVCRFARTTARNTRAPVIVRTDPDGRSLATVVRRPMAAWHFEDAAVENLRGAMGHSGKVERGILADAGRVGRCVLFDDKGGHVDCGSLSFFTPDQGLLVELWYAPKAHVKDRALVVKKGEFGLALDKAGCLHAFVGSDSESVKIDMKTAPIPAGRWTKISMTWDGRYLTLSVNDNPLARRAGEVKFAMNDNPLTIGSVELPLDGFVDEVRVDGLIEDSRVTLAEGLTVTGVPEIRFDATGALDPEAHQEPITLTVANVKGDTMAVTVNMLGGSQ